MMKLFDKVINAFDKAVEGSKTGLALAKGLRECTESVEKLAQSVAILAHNQAVHHQMITQMWNVNQVILRKINENALDTSMPDIKKGSPADHGKPN